MYRIITLIFSLLITWTSFGQVSSLQRLEVKLDNDFLYVVKPTDYYYTNGLEISFVHPDLRFNPLSYMLIRFSNPEHVQAYGLRLEQQIFTPIRKHELELQPGDRPFASTLTLESVAISTNPDARVQIQSGIQLGVMGPIAAGRQVQNGIHGVLEGSGIVEGWVNEVNNAVVVNYNITFRKGLFQTPWIRSEAGARLRMGTLYTDLTPTFTIESGILRDPFLEFQSRLERKGSSGYWRYDWAAVCWVRCYPERRDVPTG